MKNVYARITAALAMLIGIMGVTAGGPVLLGRTPNWPVITWLPVYNACRQ
jgi:hypothetical protein